MLAALAFPARADEYDDIVRLTRAGQSREALAAAERGLANRPRDPQLRFLRAVIWADMGRKAEAVDELTLLTRDYPELPEPHNNLAVLYAADGEFDKARASLELAIRANPNYAVAHENLGDVHARLAAQSYARAAQLDRANTSAAGKLAAVRQLLARPAEAR